MNIDALHAAFRGFRRACPDIKPQLLYPEPADSYAAFAWDHPIPGEWGQTGVQFRFFDLDDIQSPDWHERWGAAVGRAAKQSTFAPLDKCAEAFQDSMKSFWNECEREWERERQESRPTRERLEALCRRLGRYDLLATLGD